MSYSPTDPAALLPAHSESDRRAYDRFSVSSGQLVAEVGAEGHDATRARVHDISRGGVRLGIDEVEDWAGTNHCIIRFLDKTHRVRPAAIRGKVRRTGKDCDDSFVAIEFAEPLDELTLSV